MRKLQLSCLNFPVSKRINKDYGIYRNFARQAGYRRPCPGAYWSTSILNQVRFLSEQRSSSAATNTADDKLQFCDKWEATPEAHRISNVFKLELFTEDEILSSYADLANESGNFDRETVNSIVISSSLYNTNKKQRNDFIESIFQGKPSLTAIEFKERMLTLGEKLDPSVNNLSATFLATGLAVGLIIPLMPQVASLLDLNSTQYGIIISSFALSKMAGNIPVAKMIEAYGRKPLITAGLATIGLANLQVAFYLSYPLLLVSRVLVGQGVAAFSTAASVYLSDIATSKNRGRTIAPPITAFTVGTAIGPAIGGVLMTELGLQSTFGAVGVSFICVAAVSHFLIKEPFIPQLKQNNQDKEEGNFKVWKDILLNRDIASISMLHCGYWFVLSGSQMTLMPLLLSNDPFSCSASTLGYIFAAMSGVSVVGTSVSGKLLDRYGKISLVIPAAFVVGGSMLTASGMQELETFLPFLFTWVIAGTILSSGPTAFVADTVASDKRTKALALLRTAGDIGMLAGSMTAGVLADLFGYSNVIGSNGAALMALSTLIGFRFASKRSLKI